VLAKAAFAPPSRKRSAMDVSKVLRMNVFIIDSRPMFEVYRFLAFP